VAIRLFFFLLVFANLLFFAWAQGYFGAPDDGHEPQRLAQQLNTEKLRIVREEQVPASALALASVVKKEAAACRVVTGLSAADAEALKAAMEAAGGEAKISPLAETTLHLVVITDLANKAAADKKTAELTRFGIKDQTAVALEGGRHEIILGRFDTNAAAIAFLQGLTKRGIKSARVDSRAQPALKAQVEARAPASMLLQQLPKLIAPYADAAIGDCPP
jgi:hypothetical protein